MKNNLGSGSFTVPATLQEGNNVITFDNLGTYAADLDRIVIVGDGPPSRLTSRIMRQRLPNSAEPPAWEDAASAQAGAYAGNYGYGSQNAVTFRNVTVAQTGTYQLDIDYTTSGLRTFFVSVNDGPATQLDVNGSAFDSPVPVLLKVQLNAEANKDCHRESEFRRIRSWSRQHHRCPGGGGCRTCRLPSLRRRDQTFSASGSFPMSTESH